MSQFLLAHGLALSPLPSWMKVSPVSGNAFLTAAAAQLFGRDNVHDVATVSVGDDDFDSIFVQAQRELNQGRAFADTKLSELLAVLCCYAQGLALWYGNDYADLQVVRDPLELERIVRVGLLSPSVEAYAMFVRPN